MDSILTFQRWTCNSDTMLNFDSTSNICCADNCYKCIYFLGPPVSIDIRMQTFSLGIYFKLFKRTNLGPTIGSTLAQKKKIWKVYLLKTEKLTFVVLVFRNINFMKCRFLFVQTVNPTYPLSQEVFKVHQRKYLYSPALATNLF